MEQYEMKVGDEYYDESNILATSLVDNPATKKFFAVFSEEGKIKTKQQFKIMLPTQPNQQKVANTSKFERIISGVWFMPNTDYVREIWEDGESKLITTSMSNDELIQATKNFVQRGDGIFDVMHDGIRVEGLKTIEIWVLYDHNQMSPILLNTIEDLGYTAEQIPLGTVFMSVFVENEEFFNEMIITGKVKGFSIEGLFDIQLKQEQQIEEIMKEPTKPQMMFSQLGLNQYEGTLITREGNLTITEDKVMFNEEEISEGSFMLHNGFNIEIRDNKIVDFGFEDVQTAVTQDVVDSTSVDIVNEATAPNDTVETITIEDKVEVANKAVATEEVPNIVVEEVQIEDSAIVEEVITSNTKEVETIEVNKALEDKIKLLEEQLAATTKEKEDAIKALPIKKVRSMPDANTANTISKVVGGKTYYLPKHK